VANRADVERILQGIRASHPPLRGIVHAAGVLDDALLNQISWERFYGVIRPKVQGAWNLHELTAGDPLDFFVFFSSATAVLGSAGQASHAAANAALDALAHYRRANGLPAVTLNWGPWAEIGQAAAAAHRGARLAALGIGSIPPERGLDILGELLCGAAVQTVVLPMDWGRWSRAKGGSGAPFFSALATASAPSGGESIREAIQRAAPESRRELLTEAISRDARRVLQLNGAPIDIRRPLLQFGLDSLMALELRRGIDREVGAALPLARILGGATIEELASLAADALGEMEPSTRLSQSADWVELEL
jgi:myxalamid-type polyketide synthase MxaC